MSADLKKIEEEAFSLPAPERAHLAMSLIESLDNQIVIVAVMHLHRAPDYWRHRVSEQTGKWDETPAA